MKYIDKNGEEIVVLEDEIKNIPGASVLVEMPIVEELRYLRNAMLLQGKEIFNPEPMYDNLRPERDTIQEQIQRIVKMELSRNAMNQGYESFDEANDFDVPDEDPEPLSGYEVREMKEELPDDGVVSRSEDAPSKEKSPSKKEKGKEKVDPEANQEFDKNVDKEKTESKTVS